MHVRMRFSVVFKEVFIEPRIIKFKNKGFTTKFVALGYFGISQYKKDFTVSPINSQGFFQKRHDEHKPEN